MEKIFLLILQMSFKFLIPESTPGSQGQKKQKIKKKRKMGKNEYPTCIGSSHRNTNTDDP